jgi:hypothetical protein
MKSKEHIQKALELNQKRLSKYRNSNPYIEGIFEGYVRAFEWVLAEACPYIDELIAGKEEREHVKEETSSLEEKFSYLTRRIYIDPKSHQG